MRYNPNVMMTDDGGGVPNNPTLTPAQMQAATRKLGAGQPLTDAEKIALGIPVSVSAAATVSEVLSGPVGEDDPRYYTVKVGSTGKTSAQLAAFENATNTATVINENATGVTATVDQVTGKVTTTKKATPTPKPVVTSTYVPPQNVVNNVTDPAVLALIQSLNSQIASLTSANNSAAALAAAEKKAAAETTRRNAIEVLTERFQRYGLGSLVNKIKELAVDGATEATITLGLQETEEYKTRFKGLLALQGRGNTDVRNEAEYLNLETEYRAAFRDAGLRNYLGTDGSQSEYDSIADLVGKYSVSVDEVKSRIGDAQRVVADTPQEVRDSLQKFYNIDPLTLVEYSLDPARTQNKINSLANAAIVGGYAARGGLNIDVTGAEFIGDLAGDSDIALQPLNTEVQRGAALRDATKRLADIEKSELSDTESLTASMGADAKAQKKVQGLQSRERARFSGSGAFNSSALKSGKKV